MPIICTFESPLKVKLADDSVLPSYENRDVLLSVSNGIEKVNNMLNDVLYVLKLQNKLFSLHSITEKGASVEFKGKTYGVTVDEKKYLIGHKHGKLNTLSENEACYVGQTAHKNDSLLVWHLRCGHLGYDDLKLLNDKSMINGMPVNTMEVFNRNCEGCVVGKQHRQPFRKKSENNTSQSLELIHSHICGPMNVDSVGSSKFFVTFIDDYSRFITVYMIKQKSEAFEQFKEFINLV